MVYFFGYSSGSGSLRKEYYSQCGISNRSDPPTSLGGGGFEQRNAVFSLKFPIISLPLPTHTHTMGKLFGCGGNRRKEVIFRLSTVRFRPYRVKCLRWRARAKHAKHGSAEKTKQLTKHVPCVLAAVISFVSVVTTYLLASSLMGLRLVHQIAVGFTRN